MSYSLNGICNISRKGLIDALKCDNDEIKYVIMLLYDESHESTCESFLEKNVALINNKTNYQIAFLTRYSKGILDLMTGQVAFEKIKSHFMKYDGKTNSYEVMRYWARKFEEDGFDVNEGSRWIKTPTFVIISSTDLYNPIVYPSENNANKLKYDFERILNAIWKYYSNYSNIVSELEYSFSNKKSERNHSIIDENYELYYLVDDKLHDMDFRWKDLNEFLGYRDRSTLQEKLKKFNINKLQLICIGLILAMNRDEIQTMLKIADYAPLNERNTTDNIIIKYINYRLYEISYRNKIEDLFDDLEEEAKIKMPVYFYCK